MLAVLLQRYESALTEPHRLQEQFGFPQFENEEPDSGTVGNQILLWLALLEQHQHRDVRQICEKSIYSEVKEISLYSVSPVNRSRQLYRP